MAERMEVAKDLWLSLYSREADKCAKRHSAFVRPTSLQYEFAHQVLTLFPEKRSCMGTP